MPIPARRHKQKANAHIYMYDLSLEFQMRLRKWTKEDFVSAVNSATSIAQVLIRLGLHPTGANYKTIHLQISFGYHFCNNKGTLQQNNWYAGRIL